MRVSIPHNLPREEVRRRIREKSGELAGIVPGGLATVETGWRGDDVMDMAVTAMGQTVHGAVEVGDSDIAISFDLPPQLGMLAGMIEAKVREKGQKLLA